MTTHTPPATSTGRRRSAEQSGRIEATRRAHLRQRVTWGAGIVLVIALAIGAFAMLPRPTAAQGHQVPTEGNRQHVDQGADLHYRNRPPSSGDHYPTPAGYGVFSHDIAGGNLVHTLEHGGVVIYYRPDLCDQGCLSQLQQTYNTAPKSQRYGVVKMTVAPWSDMDPAITAAAWGWVDGMDQPDVQRILAFYREHVDRGPEDAL
jgi:hypothetical protein